MKKIFSIDSEDAVYSNLIFDNNLSGNLSINFTQPPTGYILVLSATRQLSPGVIVHPSEFADTRGTADALPVPAVQSVCASAACLPR